MSLLPLVLATSLLASRPDDDRSPGAAIAAAADAEAGSSARAAIGRQHYPWYDADRDEIRPLLPEPWSWSRRIERVLESIGDWFRRHFGGPEGGGTRGGGSLLPTLLFLIAGAALAVLCWRLWRLHERAARQADVAATIGEAARLAGIAPGAGLASVDPWAEAERRRLAGDRQGAVTWLFLGQILALDRARLIRILPGKTGRQYAAMLEDRDLRDDLRATLSVFEQVYYGRKDPEASVVDRLWERAASFRRRLASSEKNPSS
ncbi:DUF4129 domain-containing protein [Aquisphaera insulae]|uniref:DUF4129 domain-containing protein n=1 Tax=Aquisphaera insulae TaxID=2712864 RepID=UPI0013EAB6C7|nr:DUF4129 domain-containing protein [Aquisphaera insulae]